MKEFKFRVGVAPTTDTMSNMNKSIVKSLIRMHGVETMKRVLEEMKKNGKS